MLRLAVAQAPAALDGTAARIAWLASVLLDLSAEDVDLVLLPELFATGYNIGNEIPERAEAADGPIANQMVELAAKSGIALHYGYVEKAGAKLHNSAQCFGVDGAKLTHQRKLVIPPGFERRYFTAAQGCHLFTLNGFTIATLICYDAEFPETVRHVAKMGADLVLVPTALGANWGWVADTMIPTRAYENGVFLAYANSAGTENGMDFLGRSFIAAPDGVEPARAGAEAEILIADLNLDRVKQAQARLPYLQDCTGLKLT